MTLLYVDESSIDKALFAKISPRLLTTLVAHSGNIKKFTVSDFVDSIEIPGLHDKNIVQVFDYDDLNTVGEWFWDRDNETVYVYYTSAVPKKIVVFVSLFVTTSFDVLAICDPDNTNNQNRIIWRNRLQETSFSQSVEDQLNGKLGITTTSISLINNDSFYNYLASDNYSLKNAPVKVWVVINQFSNRTLIFKGMCQNASFSDSNLNLEIIEQTKLLQQDATYGDDILWTNINKTTWPNSRDEDQNKFIPYHLSLSSIKTAKETKGVFYSGFVTTYFSEFNFFDVDPRTDYKGIYVGTQPQGDVGYSPGKKYAVCRGIIITNDHRTNKTTAPVLFQYFLGSDILDYKITVSGTDYFAEWIIDVSNATTLNLIKEVYPGMRTWLYNKTTNTYLADETIITRVDTVNKIIGLRKHIYMTDTNNIHSTGTDEFSLKYAGPTVYTMKDGIPVYLPKANYYFTDENTSNSSGLSSPISYLVVTYDYNAGSKYTYYFDNTIQQWDLYPASFAGTSTDDVPELEYYVRFYSAISPNSTRGEIASALSRTYYSTKGIKADNFFNTTISGEISNTDLTSSFYNYRLRLGSTAYNDVVVSDVIQNSAKTYVDVLEQLLYSSFGFMVTNKNGYIEIRLFENEPFGTTLLELTEDDVKDRSITSDNDFSDFSSIVNSKNIHDTVEANIEGSDSDMKILVGDIRYNYTHYSKTMGFYNDYVKDRLQAYKFRSLKKYTFTIINKGYELTPGDRINISFSNSGKWLGSDTTKNLFIIRVNKALSGVVVTCIENIFP
jgi:hypothetical protein